MATYSRCPNCKREPNRDPFSGNYIEIYRCTKCKKEFCRKCSGSGESCPECGSKQKVKAGSAH